VEADAVYGVFSLLRGHYVALVTRSRQVACAPGGAVISQCLEMAFLPVLSGGAAPALSAAEAEDEALYLALLRRIGGESRSFYFASQGYDLTNSLERNDRIAAALSVSSAAAAAASASGSASGAVAAAHSPTAAGALGAAGADGASAGAGAASSLSAAAAAASHLHCDERFFWNRSASRELAAAGAHDFITPIINGFVGSADVSGSGVGAGAGAGAGSAVGPSLPPLQLLLVSRRGCARVGTRFNVRGADADGNVANYVETEQLLLLGSGRVASFVQVRGSIPLLWEQPATMRYTPKCALSANRASGFQSFQRHMQQQLAVYGRVCAVCLVDKKKGSDQLALGAAFEAACEKFGVAAGGGAGLAPFVWFDFHHETKGERYAPLGAKLLPELRRALGAQAPPDAGFVRDARGAVLQRQPAVVRTNCMDNLDRTNVVQSMLARGAALAAVDGALDECRRGDAAAAAAAAARGGGGDDGRAGGVKGAPRRAAAEWTPALRSPFAAFEAAFCALWADNADAVSRLYSGTGALKTDFTRTGARTLRGLLADGANSAERFVVNNLRDGANQDAWDLFLGRFVPERAGAGSLEGGGGGGGGGAAATPAAKAAAALKTPARAHRAEPTPLGLLLRAAALFASVTAAVSTLAARAPLPFGLSAYLQLLPAPGPLPRRLALGASVASAALSGVAFLLLKRGWPALGRLLVNRPAFVRRAVAGGGGGGGGGSGGGGGGGGGAAGGAAGGEDAASGAGSGKFA